MKNGFSWSVSYTYTTATDVSPLTSSVALSNFRSRATFNPNENVKANSAYLVKERYNGAMNWERQFLKGYKTTFGMFVETRKGKPYSWTYSNDINGDSFGGNDLMYIPSAPGSGDVIFLGDSATSRTNEDRFWSVVSANPELYDARGGVVKRNSGFSPWASSVDLRFSQQFPGFLKGNKATFILDFLNFGNLLNKRWGRIDEVSFNSDGGARRSFVSYAGIDPATGKYIYSVAANVSDFTTRQQRGESQWSVQATVRYEF
jgi:hypothetical protein